MNILAFGAHPDDIEFGCGGTLIRYAQAGHNVHLCVMTDGSYGGDPVVRRKEQESAMEFLGAKGLMWGGFRDTEMGHSREVILKMEEAIKRISPDLVLLNSPEDVHQDHRALAQAGISATRYTKEVLFFEVPTTRSFDPGSFVDITKVIDRKMELLRVHASQLDRTRVEDLSITESAMACAVFRGYQARVKHAEGFRSLRALREIR